MAYNSVILVKVGKVESTENRAGWHAILAHATESHRAKYIDNLFQTVIVHNGIEVFLEFQTKKLHLVCFKEVIHPITFIPELVIIRQETFDWSVDAFQILQRKVKATPGGALLLLTFMDFDVSEIPKNFLFYLKNKLMADYIQPDATSSSTGNWCLLLQKLQNPVDRTPNGGFQSPRNYVSPTLFKGNKTWNSLYKSIKTNQQLKEIDWDFNFKNNGTWLYLGESYSTDQAEIAVNLKLVPSVRLK